MKWKRTAMYYERRLAKLDATVGLESGLALNLDASDCSPALASTGIFEALRGHVKELLALLESQMPDADQPSSLTILRDLARIFSAVLQNTSRSAKLGSPLDHHASPAAAQKPAALTPRQHQVLELLVLGKSNKEIARQLKLREGTVKVHVAALLHALGVQNRARAAAVGADLLKDSDSKDIGTIRGGNPISAELRR
jgi:DNA-binding CsgD family transcriptional regulator